MRYVNRPGVREEQGKREGRQTGRDDRTGEVASRPGLVTSHPC